MSAIDFEEYMIELERERHLDVIKHLKNINRNIEKINKHISYDGWRDARKEVPEIETEVLAYFSGAYCVMMRLKYTNSKGETEIKWSDGNRSYIVVDAWRPLPEPPSFA